MTTPKKPRIVRCIDCGERFEHAAMKKHRNDSFGPPRPCLFALDLAARGWKNDKGYWELP